MHVEVTQLILGLDKLLDRVVNGELVVITDRGVAKAMIVPIPGGDQMSIGVEEGWLTPPKKTGHLNSPLNLKGEIRTIDAINEDRGS